MTRPSGNVPAATNAASASRATTPRAELLTDLDLPALRDAAIMLGDWRVAVHGDRELAAAIVASREVGAVVTGAVNANSLRNTVDAARRRGVPVVVGCANDTGLRRALEVRAEEWVSLPATSREFAARVRSALVRVTPAARLSSDEGERARYEWMLFDSTTALPTLPVVINRIRPLARERGRLIVSYFDFVRYAEIESRFGWERLDAVRETTVRAVQAFVEEVLDPEARLATCWVHDEDFVVLRVPPAASTVDGSAGTTGHANGFEESLRLRVRAAIAAAHGEEMAAAVDVCAGRAVVDYTPRARFERLVYRATRQAAQQARSVEQRERGRLIGDLRQMLDDGAVAIEYHPIFVTESLQPFGFEALARGLRPSLRSPEVLFGMAAEAGQQWELARLCRKKSLAGMRAFAPDALLFLNVDPHDLSDPEFDVFATSVPEPRRVVLEITERTAIRDYPRMRERLAGVRARGFRLAVDDAGAGYAGLGSIANLEPDFIKLDIGLITGIEASPVKQHLVETMVRFANEQGTRVIAEGIERAAEFEAVRSLGVHLAQGFYLHPPSDDLLSAVDVTSAHDRSAAPRPLVTTPAADRPADSRADASESSRRI